MSSLNEKLFKYILFSNSSLYNILLPFCCCCWWQLILFLHQIAVISIEQTRETLLHNLTVAGQSKYSNKHFCNPRSKVWWYEQFQKKTIMFKQYFYFCCHTLSTVSILVRLWSHVLLAEWSKLYDDRILRSFKCI